MRINMPQCGFKNCRFHFDGNCRSRTEFERCDHVHAIMMLERFIMRHNHCWLCQSYHAEKKENGKCESGCTPIWNGYYEASARRMK